MSENNNYCSMRENCGCVGYAYVPVQTIADIYDVSCALNEGTIFPELNLTIDEYGKVCHKPGGSL